MVAQEQVFADQYCAARGGAVEATEHGQTLYWLAHAGNTDPCRQRDFAAPILLAYDYNGNGRRDYGEPLVNNSHERWDDVG